MRKIWADEAWEGFEEWLDTNNRIATRIRKLIKDIDRGDNDGIGKPERLKANLSGFSSRRIDDKNRLVYRITNGCLEILSCKGHYGDK
jgi:toxin YoeB